MAHFPLQGAWKPALNISTLLTSIQLLMAEPNPDDPLMTDIVSCRLPKDLIHIHTSEVDIHLGSIEKVSSVTTRK